MRISREERVPRRLMRTSEMLVPGQVITPKISEYLANLLRSRKRTELHGIVREGYQPCVRVLKSGEERGLKRIS